MRTWALLAWGGEPQSGHVYVAGFRLRPGRIESHSAGSSRERERRVIRHLRPHVCERDDAAVRAAGGARDAGRPAAPGAAGAGDARDAADLASVVQQRRVVLRQLIELDDPKPPIRMTAEMEARDRLLSG